MKKLLSVFLVLLMALSFSACSKKEAVKEEDTVKTEEKTSENVPEKEKKEEKEEAEKPQEKPTGFSLNEKYISLVGKTKAEIDSVLGEPSGYNKEFGMALYENGSVMYGFNTLGAANTAQDIPSSNIADTAYISAKDMFFNCPSSLTPEKIATLFPHSERGYDEMDQFEFLCVYYNNTAISFDIDSPLTPESTGFLKIDSSVFYAPLEKTQNTNPMTPKKDKNNEYYEYARTHHSNFKLLNQVTENENYYFIADIDHDGKNELVVKLGFGLAVYKSTSEGIKEIYRDECGYSGGSWGCTLAFYNNKYYIMWYDGNYSQSKNLYIPANGGTDKKFMTGVCYGIDDNGICFPSIDNIKVSQSEFDNRYNEISECSFKSLESLK